HVRMGLKWHIRIDGWCARRADRVIAVSEATRRVMMEAEHVPDSQITVVYNGMEPLEPPAPASVERVREELQLGPTPVCLMLARFHPEKGHDVLLDAIPALLARKGPVTILLAGDGAYRQVIEQGVRSRGLTGAVRFLGQRKDIAELISLANVVVLPSLAESFGYAALEAMSLGRPVVATTAGGLPEVVAGGETGLLVPPGDSAALAEALFKVLHSHDLAKQMGNAGAARSIRFGFQAMIRGYESVYDGLLRERAAGKSYSRSQSGETSPRFATKDGRRP
ncbi:MAG TPA: glycosyltransferase family 4 protein, partial [Blastocatellia bacterium]|nr:glycosyltransferase family 4 protein [Blastocatellia bacterium]